MLRHLHTFGLCLLLSLALVACGGGEDDGASAASEPAAEEGLSPEQLEKGIGPIQEVTLSEEIETDLAAKGEEIFNMKCTACHKMEGRYVGPALGDVTERRTPEFVMNMILNPEEMLAKHPAAKEMLAQFMTPMPNQSLTEDEARAVLEYLRSLEGTEAGAGA